VAEDPAFSFTVAGAAPGLAGQGLAALVSHQAVAGDCRRGLKT
jgi:hypothetical protein